jgi:hypothetical protein
MAKEFITSDSEHWYPSATLQDKWYPSVTTVLKVWHKGIGFEKYLAGQNSWEESQEILKEAGRRGTIVHEATEKLERGEELVREDYELDHWKLIAGFVEWHKKYNPKVILIEKSLVSDNLETGGTTDRLYQIEDEEYGTMIVVLDIKTSKQIHDSYWIQTSVYRQLIIEHKIAVPTHTAILRLTDLRKCGYEYQFREIDDIEKDFEMFIHARNIYKYIYPNAGPKVIEVPDKLKL